MTEDEIVGWHHRLNGHEFEQAPGDSEGQGGLVCGRRWGHKGSDSTEQLTNSKAKTKIAEKFVIVMTGSSPGLCSTWEEVPK